MRSWSSDGREQDVWRGTRDGSRTAHDAPRRLLSLDYVLDHPEEALLPTERGKPKACEETAIDLGVPLEGLSGERRHKETTKYFLERLP